VRKLELIKAIDYAIVNGEPIGVIFNNGEIIINPFENLKAKRDYYFSAYDDDCKLITKPDIIIINILKNYNTISTFLKEKIGQ